MIVQKFSDDPTNHSWTNISIKTMVESTPCVESLLSYKVFKQRVPLTKNNSGASRYECKSFHLV